MSTLVFNTIKPRSGDTVTFADCNVSVGGTATYEDVTNVDSVGIITAKSGIEVGASGVGGTITAGGDVTLPGGLDVTGIVTATGGLDVTGIVTAIGGMEIGSSGVGGTITAAGYATLPGGVNAVGVVTATSFSGDGSTLSGVESGVVNFVASGAISNGATVIIKDDGTVGIITQTGSAASVGSESVFEPNSSHEYAVTYDSDNDKIVIAYRSGADNKGYAIVGTVSGTSISFGTAVEFNSFSTEYFAIAYMGSSKVFIAYRDNDPPAAGKAIVGTVSGTSISVGSEAEFVSNEILDWSSVVYDPDTGKVVIIWRDNVSPHDGRAVVATVTGTSISYGSITTFETDSNQYIGAVYDTTNDKVVIAYKNFTNSKYGTAIVGTVSGTSISFGTAVVFNSGETNYIPETLGFTNGKVVIAYQDTSNSSYGTAIVGTVSGTSISFGTPVVFESAASSYISISSNSSNGKVVISYRDEGNSDYGTVIVGTVSGTDITFGTPLVYNSAESSYTSSAYDSTSDQVVIAYRDAGGSYYGTALVYSFSTLATNLTTENYIGIAGEAISNTSTGKINIVGGINSGQSGLTTNKKYYVGPTGILTTTADTPSVVAGTSVSDTKILVWKS
jgi:hypothetical protein